MGEAIAQSPIPSPQSPVPNAQSPKPRTQQTQSTEVEETPEDNSSETQDLPPEEAQQADQEADSQLPKPEPNPFNKPSIDAILQREMNDDLWRLLRGGLPCLETSAVCLQQLQDRAIAQSPLLKEIDSRIAEANQRIEEAKSRNQRSIRLSVMSPALQYLLGPAPTAGQPQTGNGLINNIAAIFRGDTGIINGLLNIIGVRLFEGFQGGNADAQRNAIAIGDIQVKVAELQRNRAQLADTIKQKVSEVLIEFDKAKTMYQTSQVLVSRASDRFKVYEIRYRRGNSDTETYLLRQNALDNEKAQAYRAWTELRQSIFKLKLLVLSIKDAEI